MNILMAILCKFFYPSGVHNFVYFSDDHWEIEGPRNIPGWWWAPFSDEFNNDGNSQAIHYLSTTAETIKQTSIDVSKSLYNSTRTGIK